MNSFLGTTETSDEYERVRHFLAVGFRSEIEISLFTRN